MRKFFAISLLTLFLYSALVPTQVKEELAKLPTLLEHFGEHKIHTPELTFLAFLEMHYGEDFAQHRSAHDHCNLPGKSTSHQLHAPALAVLPEVVISASSTPQVAMYRPVFADQSYDFILLHDIWQPPRTV